MQDYPHVCVAWSCVVITLASMGHVLWCYSGGKDSCYNMMQCVDAGHRIVALANLHPANTGESGPT